MDAGKIIIKEDLKIKELDSPPATPDSGYGVLYIKSSDKKVYMKDSTGAETQAGLSGYSGATGTSGYSGEQGTSGYSGYSGLLPTVSSSPADTTFDGIKTTLVCHETIAQGDVCYINTDGEAQLAQANAIANSSGLVLATESGVAGNTKTFLVQGFARVDSWSAFTAGSFIYLSAATAGKITNTAPSATNNVIQILGWAKTTKTIFFSPSLVQVEHT